MDKRVNITACADYDAAEQAVFRCLEAFGGAKAILGGKKRVLVKPNLIMPRSPNYAATTHPAIVSAVCRAFVEAGAEVGIIDSTGVPHTQATLKTLFSGAGMEEPVKRAGALLVYDTSVKTLQYPDGVKEKSFHILSPIADADLVVTVAKLKTHGFTAFSGCVKNLFGAVPGLEKSGFHRKYPDSQDFCEMLVDLCECIKPGFAVMDAIVGMEGQGPTGGSPKKLGAVLAGFNPYAVDIAGSYLIGARPDSVLYLKSAADRDFAPGSFSDLKLSGDAPEGLRTMFIPARKKQINLFSSALGMLLPRRLKDFIRRKRAPYPIITGKCVGCGDCARVCPQQIIQIKDKRAVIDYGGCIKCYCCHEFCPAKAVDYGDAHD